MAETFPFRKPIVEINAGNLSLGDSLVKMNVISDLNGKADTTLLEVEDYDQTKRGLLERGMPLSIKWGYQDEPNRQEIFRGVVRDVDHAGDPLTIRGIDFNAALNAHKIKKTFQDETADGIIKAVLNEVGIGSEIEVCELEIPRLPFFNISVRKCIDTVTELLFKETGELFFDYIRNGVFHWGSKDFDQEPVQAFRTGTDIIRFQRSEAGLSLLETMVCPVLQSQIIIIDDESWFVNRVEYHWNEGGRTHLWVEQCD